MLDHEALSAVSEGFRPRRIERLEVNEATALFLDAEDLHFALLGTFRILDRNGCVILCDPCQHTSMDDQSSPLWPLNGTSVVGLEIRPRGELVDASFHFSGGFRLDVFDTDPYESWSLSFGEQVLR